MSVEAEAEAEEDEGAGGTLSLPRVYRGIRVKFPTLVFDLLPVNN